MRRPLSKPVAALLYFCLSLTLNLAWIVAQKNIQILDWSIVLPLKIMLVMGPHVLVAALTGFAHQRLVMEKGLNPVVDTVMTGLPPLLAIWWIRPSY